MSRRYDLDRLPALELAERAARRGVRLIRMPGAPNVAMPEHVVDAVLAQLSRTHDRDSRGTPQLRRSVAEMLRDRDHVEVDPDRELIITHGAAHGLSVTLGAFCDPGDDVVVPVPTYFFDGPIARCGATPRHVACRPAAHDWALDLDAIADAVTDRTRAILLCNPVNPTGRLHTSAEIDAVVHLARQRGVILIADESFSHYVYDGPFTSVATRRSDYDRIITIQSLSKNYAFADWRVGYVHGPQHLIDAVHRCFEWDGINVGSVPQAAAVAAITGPRVWIDRYLHAYPAKRDTLLTLVRAAGFRVVRPGAGAAMLVDFRPLGVAGRVLENRLLDHGIAAVAGDGFHGPADHARLLFGGEAEDLHDLGKALSRLVRPGRAAAHN
ncbi:pyridoxal phosphate-dependent aminotransferase [Dactylosporangium sp. CA-092794]|uniref:pyridoxal phosphate-dependent aminotransferase n=1 Tax=Dactylosporangium sp. CA-092794 TaxID=3239929 RepID=UPI003D8E280F